MRRKHRVLFPEFIVRNMFVVLAKIMRRSLPEVLLSILTCCVWQKYIWFMQKLPVNWVMERLAIQQMMPMQWNTLTKCASVPVWNPKIRLLTKIFVVSVDWNFVWKDSIGMTWYVELIINNRKYSIISPDRIGVLLFL